MTTNATNAPTLRTLAWTGGCSPLAYAKTTTAERVMTRHLFAEQCNAYAAYWGVAPCVDIRRTYWTRARYDAHATMRAALH